MEGRCITPYRLACPETFEKNVGCGVSVGEEEGRRRRRRRPASVPSQPRPSHLPPQRSQPPPPFKGSHAPFIRNVSPPSGNVENKNNLGDINDKMYRLEREVEVKQKDEDFVEIKEEIEEINELEGFIEGNPKNVNEINTGMEQHELSKDNTGPECKDRWESLQSQYCKHVNEAKPRSGQAAASSSKWKNENQMAFLYTFMKDRSQISTVTQEAYELEDENAHDDEETLSGQENWNSEGEPPEKKYPPPKQVRPKCKRALKHISHSASATPMKYLLEKKKEECAPDTIDTFFSLMAATVKKFNPSDQHFIKIKVFSLVKEIERKYIQYQNSHSYAAFPQSICPSSAMPSPSQYSDTSTELYTQPLQETPYH